MTTFIDQEIYTANGQNYLIVCVADENNKYHAEIYEIGVNKEIHNADTLEEILKRAREEAQALSITSRIR